MEQKISKELKNTIFITLIAAVIFSIAVYLLIHFFTNFFLLKSDDYITSGIGAFMGAFSAFIFLIIEKAFSKYQKRRTKHFDGLVKAEYLLNENLQIISDDIYLVRGFLSVVEKGHIYIGSFRPILWDKKILLDLANLDLINNLASYGIDIEKTNRDLHTLPTLYQEIRTALLNNIIDRGNFKANTSIFIGQIKSMVKILENVDNKTELRLSEVRVALKNRNAIDWFFNKISSHKLHKNFSKQVSDELNILKKERDEIRKQSIKELASIKGKK